MDANVIYYAAPQYDDHEEYIPNDERLWISVHGSLPVPNIDPSVSEFLCLSGNGFDAAARRDSTVSVQSRSSISSLEPLMESDVNEEKYVEDGSLSDLN